MPEALPEFFLDLKNKNMETSACIFHQRFSTNTLPEWRLAQPFRYLAHNGEINTIQETGFGLKLQKNIFSRIYWVIFQIFNHYFFCGSDSMSLDNMLELMQISGMSIIQAMKILMPPA